MTFDFVFDVKTGCWVCPKCSASIPVPGDFNGQPALRAHRIACHGTDGTFKMVSE